jgi:hypothetical protein
MPYGAVILVSLIIIVPLDWISTLYGFIGVWVHDPYCSFHALLIRVENALDDGVESAVIIVTLPIMLTRDAADINT